MKTNETVLEQEQLSLDTVVAEVGAENNNLLGDDNMSKENKNVEVTENEVVETEVENNDVASADEVVEKFQRTTRLEKSSVNRTIKWLHKNREKLKFDLAIQRNEVWTLEQKSNLIHSILYGFPIPPVMAMETDDSFHWFLDGKQRGTTLLQFVNDEFALSKKTDDVIGHKIAGLKFSDLSEDMQDAIYDETITVIKIKGITNDEINEMFIRWNSGTALNKMELTRAIYGELIEQVNEVSQYDFFAEDIKLSKSARNRFQDQELILQIAMLIEKGQNDIKGFGSKEITEFIKEMKSKNKLLMKKTLASLKTASSFLHVAYDNLSEEGKKAMKKVNVPIVFNQALTAIEQKIKPTFFAEFIEDFLVVNYSIDSVYGESLQSGSSKKENVLTRINEMDLAFQDFVEKAEKEKRNDIYKNTK